MRRSAVILFIVILLAFIISITNYSFKSQVLEEAAKSHYQPNVSFEIDGVITKNINSTAFTYSIFGFKSEVLVLANELLSKPMPTSSIHSASIYGHFDNEGVFHMQSYRLSYYQILKYFVSALGLIIFLAIFIGEWKLTLKGFELRDKNA